MSDSEADSLDLQDDTSMEQNQPRSTWQPDEWRDDSDDDEEDGYVSEHSQSQTSQSSQMDRLKKELHSLPLSAVLKAQSHRSDSTPGPSVTREQRIAQIRDELGRKKPKKSIHTIADEKRDNKHAPTVLSSKKQVSRSRQVIDVQKQSRRDPRFSSLSAGQVDQHIHSKSYAFLPDMLETELGVLKTAVALAVKAEKTCAWSDKASRTAERERLEFEMGQVRSRLDRARTDERERSVLSQAKKEEREKRAQGKGAWYMKKAEKRDKLLQSKFDSLEAQGQTALKKAMEKKRRKSAAKEKKSRPDVKRRRVE